MGKDITATVRISWLAGIEPDIKEFQVYFSEHYTADSLVPLGEPVPFVPDPSWPGTPQRVKKEHDVFVPFGEEKTLWYAVKAIDEQGNESEFSNMPNVWIDNVPPSKPQQLMVEIVDVI